jgi:hypothetical protein
VVSEKQGGDSRHIRGVSGGTADGQHGGYGERSRGVCRHLFRVSKETKMTRALHRLALTCLAVATAVTLAACQREQAPNADSASPPPSPTGVQAPASHQQPPAGNDNNATSGSISPRPGRTPSQPASPVVGRRTDFGFIPDWYTRQGRLYLRFDRAILLTGPAADAASAAHGGESPVPNDYYIQNDNPRLRDVPVRDGVTVVGSIALTGSPAAKLVSLQALLSLVTRLGSGELSPPFDLRYDAQGQVSRVQEMYVP